MKRVPIRYRRRNRKRKRSNYEKLVEGWLKEDGIKYERKIAYRKRLVQEIRDVLIYTPEIKKNANMFYPNMNVDELWEQFVQMCEDQYYRWHAELTHDNYAQVFYTYLNKITAKIVIPKD